MTQKQRILEYIKKNGSISQLEAMRLGIGRLSARIMELRLAGFDIRCDLVSGVNEYGPYKYGRYSLAA